MSSSVIVKKRVAKFDKIVAFILIHLIFISEKTVGRLPSVEGLDPMEPEQMSAFIKGHIQNAREAAERMEAKDEEYNEELGEDSDVRSIINKRTGSAYKAMSNFKAVAQTTYGKGLRKSMQLDGTTPRDARSLLQQLRLAVNWLTNPEKEFPPLLNPMGSPLNRESILAQMTTVVEQLESVISDYARELRETETAMLAKNKAIDEFDLYLKNLTGLSFHMMKLAGLDKEAERLNPNRLRTRSKKTETDDESES